MKAVIFDPRYADEPPSGMIHQTAGKLRVGIMQFNHDGSPSECDQSGYSFERNNLLDLAEKGIKEIKLNTWKK